MGICNLQQNVGINFINYKLHPGNWTRTTNNINSIPDPGSWVPEPWTPVQ